MGKGRNAKRQIGGGGAPPRQGKKVKKGGGASKSTGKKPKGKFKRPINGGASKKGAKGTSKGKPPGHRDKAGKEQQTSSENTVSKGIKRKAVWTKNDSTEVPSVRETDKKGNLLNIKQRRRKEVTRLYGELITPGKEKKSEVVGRILELLAKRTTPLEQYCSSEIGSRVVQACLKWGSMEHRQQLLSKLKEHLAKMATDRFGHVVVLKLLRYSARTSKERKPTVEEKKTRENNLKEFLEVFHGKSLNTVFFHKYGCRVVNGIYFSDDLGVKEKRLLLHEVAVPQVVLLLRRELVTSLTLRKLFADKSLSAQHRDAMLQHLTEAVERAVDKELLGVDIVHILFQTYCELATESQLRDLAEKCMAGAPYLLSSKPGAEAALRLLGVANAKQRKALCKDLKGKYVALATNPVDYTVMMRFASTVDDTVMIGKSMLSEWIGELSTLVFEKYGHKVLVWLLRPDDPHFFSPYERECLALPSPTSMKAAETRRQELVRTLRPPLRTALQAEPLKIAADLHAKNVLTAYLTADWDGEILESLVAAAEAEVASNNDVEMGLLGNGTVTTTLLVLLKLEPEGTDASLAGPLWRRCFEPNLTRVAASRCAFVLLALLKRGDKVATAVRSALRKGRKQIDAAVKAIEASGVSTNGARKLLAALEESNGGQ
eukprot:TRINITY_DN44020_c0_g1_i1.p1 TRINITY_DN44020_c0_g1~~TRINITY_DN44020_c0_g1_i1.p1  ORF type:complete len:659 (-),score=134.10 TRINITY_DN44020_c0_g1_i1:288-2264(-)